ncbi:MAG: MCP four helix bundle domain-containing protein, partial [Dehalococcoidales bacterium]|nr:MCP four helix bundle domain-containing protein [Dehalococcoidales bacterium]
MSDANMKTGRHRMRAESWDYTPPRLLFVSSPACLSARLVPVCGTNIVAIGVNMKFGIGIKLTGAFFIVASIVAVVGMLGYWNIGKVVANGDAMFTNRLLPSQNIGAMKASMMQMSGDLYRYLILVDERPEILKSIESREAEINEDIATYSAGKLSEEETQLLTKLQQDWSPYSFEIANAVKVIDKINTAPVLESISAGGTLYNLQQSLGATIDSIVEYNQLESINLQANSIETGKNVKAMILLGVVIGAFFALGLGVLITSSITRPIGKVSKAAQKISEGDINIRIDVKSRDETGDLARAMQNAAYYMKDMAQSANRIAVGDLTTPVQPKSDNDVLGHSLLKVNTNLQLLIADTKGLSVAAVNGQLSARADVSKHQGDYAAILQGVNDTLDAVIGPLNMAADYVDKIAKGTIPPQITDSYNGDFNIIKNNLNTCARAINRLIADTKMLSAAAVEGNLSAR